MTTETEPELVRAFSLIVTKLNDCQETLDIKARDDSKNRKILTLLRNASRSLIEALLDSKKAQSTLTTTIVEYNNARGTRVLEDADAQLKGIIKKCEEDADKLKELTESIAKHIPDRRGVDMVKESAVWVWVGQAKGPLEGLNMRVSLITVKQAEASGKIAALLAELIRMARVAWVD